MASNHHSRPLPERARIAYLLADGGIPFSHSQKGASIHARSMCRAFQMEGHEVEVFAFRKGDKPTKGFNVRQIHQSRLTRWYFKHLMQDEKLRRLLTGRKGPAPNWMVALGILLWQRDLWRAVRGRCQKERPDLIYARNAWLAYPYYKAKRLLGVPLVLEVNAVLTIEKDARREIAFSSLTRRIEKKIFEAADLILPVSAELKEQIASLGIDPDKIVVTPNAVDLELFHPRAEAVAAATNGHGPDPARPFMVGAVNSFKGYHGMETMLAAAARLKDRLPGLRLRLIGSGENLPQMRQLARELGVDGLTEFTGVVEHERVPKLLRECDAAVAPYQGPQNQYNCPMKLYEYMALKLPVVAAAWGDIPNIVKHGQTALLHREADADSLAECLYEVWQKPAEARARVEAAYQLAERQTWRATARRIFEWLNARRK